jgi:hypothetical protein
MVFYVYSNLLSFSLAFYLIVIIWIIQKKNIAGKYSLYLSLSII